MSYKQKDAKWNEETQSGTYPDKIHWGEMKVKQPADPLDEKKFSARDMSKSFEKGYLRGVDEVYEKEKGIPSTALNRSQYLQSLQINLPDNDK